jgi:ferredoxin-thioredoxin reductase catalytic subunit
MTEMGSKRAPSIGVREGERLHTERRREKLRRLRGLARNKVRVGAAYCPCRLRSGDPEKDRIIICPCIYHEKEIEEQGACHCRLFFKKGE